MTLEVGPGQQLTGLVKNAAAGRPAGVATLPPADDPSSLLLAAGRLWAAGVSLNWGTLHADGERRRVPLPTYPFERKRYWVDHATTSTPESTAQIITVNTSLQEDKMTAPLQSHPTGRRDGLVDRLRGLFADLSGMDAAQLDPRAAFLELGLDSLFLTQAALTIGKTFGVKISFRELLEDLSTIDALAAHLDRTLPAEAKPTPSPVPSPVAASAPVPQPVTTAAAPAAGAMERLIADQLEVMRRQLEIMGTSNGAVGPVATPVPPTREAPAESDASSRARDAAPCRFRAPSVLTGLPTRRRWRSSPASSSRRSRRSWIATCAGPRSPSAPRRRTARVSPIRGPWPASAVCWKEIVYPIVTVRSAGSRLWDVDGNEYIDLTNGFGIDPLRPQPPTSFARRSQAQLRPGHRDRSPVDPCRRVSPRASRRWSGMERVAFCNTGSEAVTAAIRLARTVTGRDKIAMFAGAYHGIFDEVLVRVRRWTDSCDPCRSRRASRSSMVDNVVVLDYGSPESLEHPEGAHRRELAAVLVEPVQSRRPDLQPASSSTSSAR